MSIFRRYSTAPPPRRRAARVVRTSTPAPPRRIFPSVPHNVSARLSPSASEHDHFNPPLYTLKAFSIATAIVLSSATASVFGVLAYLDVRDTTEFAARMRTWVSQSMPLLTAKIYRRPTADDSVDGDPVLVASTPRHEPLTPPVFDHDAAHQRLSEAFDKSGFDGWAEAAAMEIEAEIEVERSRRGKMA